MKVTIEEDNEIILHRHPHGIKVNEGGTVYSIEDRDGGFYIRCEDGPWFEWVDLLGFVLVDTP